MAQKDLVIQRTHLLQAASSHPAEFSPLPLERQANYASPRWAGQTRLLAGPGIEPQSSVYLEQTVACIKVHCLSHRATSAQVTWTLNLIGLLRWSPYSECSPMFSMHGPTSKQRMDMRAHLKEALSYPCSLHSCWFCIQCTESIMATTGSF